MINKTKVTLTFDQTAGTNNRVAQNSVIKKSGQAYIIGRKHHAQPDRTARCPCNLRVPARWHNGISTL